MHGAEALASSNKQADQKRSTSMDNGKLINDNKQPKVEESTSHYQLSTLNSPLVKEGYKQTEVGVIPEGWEVVALDSVVSKLVAGISVNSTENNDTDLDEDYLILKTSCVYKGIFFPSESKKIKSTEVHRAKLNVQKNTLIISRMNTPQLVGECGYINRTYKNIFIPDRLWLTRFSNKNSVSPRLLTFLLSYKPIADTIKDMATGTSNSMKNIAKSNLLTLLIPLPKLKEQKAIAKALTDMDALIEAQEKLIAKKQAIKTATMQQLLTGKTRLRLMENGKWIVDNENKHRTKQTELGEIPEDWEVVRLDKIGKSFIGLTYSPSDVVKDGVLVLRSSNIQKNMLVFENNVFVDMKLPSRVVVKENDILICVRNGSRNLIGKCALIDKKTEGNAFGAFMSIFRAESPIFVFYQFQSNIIQRQINEIMGATINQITNKDMAFFKILYPNDEKEREAIGSILHDISAEIDCLESKLKKTKSIKQGMMQELLTGKTRLIES